MSDLGSLTQQTADRLAARRAGVVVAALAGGATEIRGSGGLDGRSVLEIGSLTKVFTGLALARLVVRGVVELDEPLAKVLPEGATVPARGGEEITLRQLATHTSGLPRLPTGMLLPALLNPGRPDPYAHCTTPVLLAALARTRLGAVPGRRFRYSNFGAGLLGLALAHRAGVSYEMLVTREIGTPLGLADTGLEDDPARLAQGHDPRGRPVEPWHLADLAGAGGLRSTGADLATFLHAQLTADDEAVRFSREVRHRVTAFAWIHLGWMGRRLHARQGGHLQLWHNGATGGCCSFAAFDPEKQVAVAVLTDTRRPVDREAFDLLTSLQNAR